MYRLDRSDAGCGSVTERTARPDEEGWAKTKKECADLISPNNPKACSAPKKYSPNSNEQANSEDFAVIVRSIDYSALRASPFASAQGRPFGRSPVRRAVVGPAPLDMARIETVNINCYREVATE
jgi:hypothetical protein